MAREHEQRQGGQDGQTLHHPVLQTVVVRVVILRVHFQHLDLHGIEQVAGGVFRCNEIRVDVVQQRGAECLQLLLIRQVAEDEQERRRFITHGRARFLLPPDEFVDRVPAVDQLSLGVVLVSVDHLVAHHVADPREAHLHACAVFVSQPLLHPIPGIQRGVDEVVLCAPVVQRPQVIFFQFHTDTVSFLASHHADAGRHDCGFDIIARSMKLVAGLKIFYKIRIAFGIMLFMKK